MKSTPPELTEKSVILDSIKAQIAAISRIQASDLKKIECLVQSAVPNGPTTLAKYAGRLSAAAYVNSELSLNRKKLAQQLIKNMLPDLMKIPGKGLKIYSDLMTLAICFAEPGVPKGVFSRRANRTDGPTWNPVEHGSRIVTRSHKSCHFWYYLKK